MVNRRIAYLSFTAGICANAKGFQGERILVRLTFFSTSYARQSSSPISSYTQISSSAPTSVSSVKYNSRLAQLLCVSDTSLRISRGWVALLLVVLHGPRLPRDYLLSLTLSTSILSWCSTLQPSSCVRMYNALIFPCCHCELRHSCGLETKSLLPAIKLPRAPL